MTYRVRVEAAEGATHDTRRLVLERPSGYRFEPGQAAEIALDKDDWREEARPFSFTSLEEDTYLEFVVKIYGSHEGVTKQLGKLAPGSRLLISEPFGTISYRGEGYFIAGGAGITPFMSILRRLHRDGRLGNNKLLYSNRTERDIILKTELDSMLGANVVYNLTHEPNATFHNGLIDARYLRVHAPDISRTFNVCGPDEMVRDIRDILQHLGADVQSLVFEK